MDTHSLPPEDLNDLEQRLSAWQPSETGLAPDAMLFAAGRASARRGKARLAWQVICGCLALAVVALGVRLAAERAERLALAERLERRLPEAPSVVDEKPAPEPPPSDAYLVLRRQWEQHPGDGTLRSGRARAPNGPAVPEPPILRAWQPNGPPESL